MFNFAMSIQYNGTNYAGWQYQPNAMTVQQRIEETLLKITGQNLKIIGSGRTDSGVHARAQIANFRTETELKIGEVKLLKALNHYLPKDIRINDIVAVDEEFHSRFSAMFREYSYSLTTKDSVFHRNFTSFCKYHLDINLLIKSAEIFQKKADFTTYSKINPDLINPICDVQLCEWKQQEEFLFELRIKSNHFLYGMVRSIVGAMIDIARNKITIEQVKSFLEKKDRNLNSPLADAKGLVLEKIYYPDKYGIE